jgi:hypothetical protein
VRSSVIAIVLSLGAAGAAGNDAAAKPGKCTSRCEYLPRGFSLSLTKHHAYGARA